MAPKSKLRNGSNACAQQMSVARDGGLIDRRQWAGNVADLHRVLDVVFSLYLLIEQHNEAVVRVAVEILLHRKKVLAWDRATWYASEDNRAWFATVVKEELAHVFRMLQVSFRAGGDRSAEDLDLQRMIEENGSGCPRCRRCEQELRKLQEALREAEARASSAEEERDELFKKAAAAAEANKSLQSELAAAMARAKKAEAENRRMSVATEEMSQRLRGFVSEAEASGSGAKVRVLIEESGLGNIVRSQNVWEKLYNDAKERILRLAKLQEEYRCKHGSDPLMGINLMEEFERLGREKALGPRACEVAGAGAYVHPRDIAFSLPGHLREKIIATDNEAAASPCPAAEPRVAPSTQLASTCGRGVSARRVVKCGLVGVGGAVGTGGARQLRTSMSVGLIGQGESTKGLNRARV